MNNENQVCSLPLAKRLKELNVPQESYFAYYREGHHWFNGPDGSREIQPREATLERNVGNNVDFPYEQVASAFTGAEISELLPSALHRTATWLTIVRQWNQEKEGRGNWLVGYVPDEGEPNAPRYTEESETLADAMAKMLIHLITNGLMPESLPAQKEQQ